MTAWEAFEPRIVLFGFCSEDGRITSLTDRCLAIGGPGVFIPRYLGKVVTYIPRWVSGKFATTWRGKRDNESGKGTREGRQDRRISERNSTQSRTSLSFHFA